MITRQMIANALQAGVIRIVDSPYDDGAVCQIGNLWFYFGGQTAEEESAASYVQHIPQEDIVREIYEVLEDFRKEEDPTEYQYYESILWANGVSEKTIDQLTPEERDRELEALWAMFTDVPMNPETERMEESFLHFPAGTHREEIWHWFDARYRKGVYALLYPTEEKH